MGMDVTAYYEMHYQLKPSYITEEENKLDVQGDKWDTTCSKLANPGDKICKAASSTIKGEIKNSVSELYRNGLSSENISQFNSIAMDLYEIGMENLYKDLFAEEEKKAEVERLKPKERSAASSEPIVTGTGKDFAQNQMQKTVVCPTKKSNHNNPEDVQYTFPSEKIIGEYLENHPLTSEPFIQGKGVVEAAAHVFSDQTRVRNEIAIGSMIVLDDLRKKLPKSSLGLMHMNLTGALNDCAEGKEIERK